MDSQTIFSEKQRFSQVWWIWVILLPVNGLFVFGVIQQLVFGKQFGTKAASDAGLLIALVIALLVTILIYVLRLETEIRNDGIYTRFYPVQRKFRQYTWQELKACYIRKYNPILEYGGWGIRGIGKNQAFNVSGNMGIQLISQADKKFLIGTQKPGEAESALRQIGKLRSE